MPARESRSVYQRLRNAERETFELYDINEEMEPHDKHTIVENIDFLLRRKKLVPPRGHVIIPEGGYDYEIEEVDGVVEWRFAGGWELFGDARNILATGEVRAWGLESVHEGMIVLNEIEVTVDDVPLEGRRPVQKL